MTRVAVISTNSPDYSIDILTDGLIRVLGRQNIALHFTKNHMANDPRYTHLMSGFFDQPNSFSIYEADFLAISTRSGADLARSWISHSGKRNVAMIDGQDEHIIHPDLLSFSKIYFKREYLKGHPYPPNIRPFPFAAIPEEPHERVPIERTVFFMGHWNDVPARQDMAHRLAYMGYPPSTTSWTKTEYNRALRGSMIGVSVRGWGWDTYRYWEIPYFGCCLISEHLAIEIPNNFKDGEEAVFFTDGADFQKKLSDLLNDPYRAQEIGARGRQACLDRHLSIHRAKTVLEAML